MGGETAGEIVARVVFRGKGACHCGGEAWLDVVEPVAGTADISGKRRGAQPRRGKLKPLAGAGEAGGDRKAPPPGPGIEPPRPRAGQILRVREAPRPPRAGFPGAPETPPKAPPQGPPFLGSPA